MGAIKFISWALSCVVSWLCSAASMPWWEEHPGTLWWLPSDKAQNPPASLLHTQSSHFPFPFWPTGGVQPPSDHTRLVKVTQGIPAYLECSRTRAWWGSFLPPLLAFCFAARAVWAPVQCVRGSHWYRLHQQLSKRLCWDSVLMILPPALKSLGYPLWSAFGQIVYRRQRQKRWDHTKWGLLDELPTGYKLLLMGVRWHRLAWLEW